MSETLLNPYFGEFGGMYVPEILVPVLQQLEKAFVEAKMILNSNVNFKIYLKIMRADQPHLLFAVI